MNSRFKVNCLLSLFLVLTLCFCALPVHPQEAAPARAPEASKPSKPTKIAPFKRQPSSAALKWANEELRRMSLEEKVGQLISVGINATFLNQESDAYRALKRHVEDNKIGGIILFRS